MKPVGAPSTKTGATRIPVIHVVVSCCGPQGVFPIKVDSKMTVELLRDVAWQLYTAFCLDEGIVFKPPSLFPHDYDVHPCFADGARDESQSALRPAALGGGIIREFLATQLSPAFVTMEIGQLWLERDSLFQAEAAARAQLVEGRLTFVEEASFFADISLEKRRDAQLFRERQASMGSKVEDALLYAYVELRKSEAKIRLEHEQLCKAYQLWALQRNSMAVCFDQVNQKKRMFLTSSAATVACVQRSNTQFL